MELPVDKNNQTVDLEFEADFFLLRFANPKAWTESRMPLFAANVQSECTTRDKKNKQNRKRFNLMRIQMQTSGYKLQLLNAFQYTKPHESHKINMAFFKL